MRLSIVIVNYNVRHYLDQCLHSIYTSSHDGFEIATWVVDNNSVDDSLTMVRAKYPQVRLIANEENVGFGRANNQALRMLLKEPGEDKEHYILLLNPDTILQTDTLQKCIEFFGSHADCGALGVKMLNAEGTFLRESKRGFPSPRTSFYKICGLSHLFPTHPRYAAYYMGNLDDDGTAQVDILPGAFILTRADVLRKVGLFDESYFMYAEDVDFSWRIKQAGYNNYYFPETRILHYKGECTRKETFAYVRTFYGAMAIFSNHYFGKGRFGLKSIAINIGIFIRALLAILSRAAMHLALPAIDLGFSIAGFVVIKNIWATYWAENALYYPPVYTWVVLPAYSLILLLSVFLSGGYDRPVRLLKIAQGLGIGAFLLLAFYSLLDETMRYSRAIILLGSLWTFLSTFLIRLLLMLIGYDGYNSYLGRHRRYLIVGNEEQRARVVNLLDTIGVQPRSLQSQPTTDKAPQSNIDEIVFCANDIALADILDATTRWRNRRYNFRIVPATDGVLIGSNYIESPEQFYNDRHSHIASPSSRRKKFLFDITTSLLLLIFSPLLFWIQKDKRHYFPHIFSVLAGRHTWVGYSSDIRRDTPLPHLRPAILTTRHRFPNVRHPDIEALDNQYAQNYRAATDFTILILNLQHL